MEIDWLTNEVMWFLIGLVLLVTELALPSFILIFFGIGAWVTALTIWFTDVGIETQLIVFILTSLISLLIFRNRFLSLFDKQNAHFTDDVESDFIGKVATTIEPVNSFSGKVLFNGTQWKAISDDNIKSDQKVEVISKDNITLKIKSL
jgi:membrane protein implicated in regulation of membrane protease activity